MKLAFSLLMCLAAATLMPVQAATKVATYEQAQAKVNEEGYILFVYGDGWDKRAKEQMTALYNAPEIVKAAGNSVMMLVPLPESLNEAQKAALEKTLGKLALPHVHSKHAFPAVVMYDKAGRIYTWISGPAMVYPEAGRIALTISRRKAGLQKQQQILAAANETTGEDRANLLLQACRVENLERPDRVQQLIKEADPEDKAGCLAALNFFNTTVGDKAADMTLADILKAQDAAIANPLHTVQQKQNACAYAIGTIRRRAGAGGSALIRQYATQMKQLDPNSVLGQSADIVIRDWTHGLQLVRGWSPGTLPIQGQPTELLGKLPISEAGTYKLHFKPTGGDKAIIARVALYDGDTLISEDVRTTAIADNGQDHYYTLTATAKVNTPRIFITFNNEESDRNTYGKFFITKD
jgi:hypothetical protein